MGHGKTPILMSLDDNLLVELDKLPRNELKNRSKLVERLLWEWLKNERGIISGSSDKREVL
jgi:metal-responsive CopG/Arc/MetJ family transcriptional regulator